MTRYAMALALTVGSLGLLPPARSQDGKKAADPKADLAALQGKWERVSTTDLGAAAKAKAVKEIRGDQETLSRYSEDGTLINTSRVTIKLSESGPVRVLTFSNGEVLEGLGKGRKATGSWSYVYRLDGDELFEAGGLMVDSPYAQDVPYFVKWKRAGKAAAKPGAAAEGDGKLVQGEWSVASQEVDGEQVPAGLLKSLTVTIDGDTFRVKSGADVVQEGTQTLLDQTTTPKAIDVKVTGGRGKGDVWLGIYKVDGDTFTVCFDPTGKKRPTEFKTSKESGTFMNVHKRVKK